MLKFNFGKSKKVFEKLNKMDRKQAYTIGAIVVVLVVALMLLVSAMGSGEDDSFDGMKARGYDLAQMPFVNDEAEQYLLAAKYPDMRENASTLLYSAAEKEARQEEDEQSEEDEEQAQSDNDDEFSTDGEDNGNNYGSGSGRSYGGYGGRGGGGRGKTEIGTLGTASMGSASGSGVNSYYGPSGDFRQFGKKEGYVAPAQLKTDNARNALGQFRSGSYAANRLKDNKMINARRAAQGAAFQGSDAFGKEGIDVEKLGGLGLDTDAPPTTSDLGNLDKQVADAAKDADKPKDPDNKDSLSWWEQMLQDLAKQAFSALVGSVMDAVGDSIKGSISGNNASRAARNEYGASMAGKKWNADGKCTGSCLTQDQTNELIKNGVDQTKWEAASVKQQKKYGRDTATAWAKAGEDKSIAIGNAQNTVHSADYNKKEDNKPCNGKECNKDTEVLTATCECVPKATAK